MISLLKPFNGCSYMEQVRVTTEQWNRLIKNPLVIDDKHDAPLMIFGSMADYVEIDKESGQPRCTGANIEEIYALPVDIDNGCTMEMFERDFHKYSYQLYTTYSWHNGKEGDRFRVFFPLKEPIKVKWLEGPVKQYLRNLFSMADQSCFDRGHWQVLPCVGSRENDYRYVQHQGELLSFAHKDFAKMWEEYKEEAHWKREIAEADRDPSSNHKGALQHVQQVFDVTYEGSRDRTVYSKIKWLRDDVGCTYDEVICLRPPMGFEREYIDKVNKMYGCR